MARRQFTENIASRGSATIVVAATEQIHSSPLLSVAIRFQQEPSVSLRFRLFPLFPNRTNARANLRHRDRKRKQTVPA